MPPRRSVQQPQRTNKGRESVEKPVKSTAIALRPKLTPTTVSGRAGRGLEEFKSEDVIIPYAILIQKLSPQLDEDSTLEAGDIINSITLNKYEQPILFIPLMLTKQRRCWRPRTEGGGMLCGSVSEGNAVRSDLGERYDEICAMCDKSQWNEGTPPECTFYRTYPSLVVGVDDMDKLTAISFPETNKHTGGAGKRLANLARMASGDIFSRMYTLESNEQQNKEGQKYFALSISQPQSIHKDDYKQALEYFEMIESLKPAFHEEGITPETERAPGPDDTPF